VVVGPYELFIKIYW